MCCDSNPDITNAAQRKVTVEEHEELVRLEMEYKKFQALLTEIQQRSELEFEEIWSGKAD
jgi:hypothetical protein